MSIAFSSRAKALLAEIELCRATPRALSKLEANDPRFEPDLSALATVKTSDLLCALSQRYVTTALTPLVSSAVGVRRDLAVLNQANVSRIETKVNAILHRLLDGKSSLLLSLT